MRRRIAMALATICAGMLATGPVSSQGIAPGYSGSMGIIRLPPSDGWIEIRQLGTCLVGTKRSASRALLTAAPGSADEVRVVRALIGRGTSCLRYADRLHFTTPLLRGAVAEALYKREYGAPPAPAESEGDVSNLREFADCFAAREPAAIHRLLTTTRLGDESEHELLSSIAPRLGQCLPADREVRLDAQAARTVLAEAIYQRARAVAPPRGE